MLLENSKSPQSVQCEIYVTAEYQTLGIWKAQF